MSSALVMQLSLLDPSSGWSQRWQARRPSWRHTSEGGFDPARYRVVSIDEGPAKAFVTSHHYLRSYPAAKLRYGLVDADRLVGVAVLGIPPQRAVLSNVFPDLEPYTESLDLSRLVLLDEVPANAETWFIARVFRHAAGLGVRGVVAFADPMPRMTDAGLVVPGHIGTVYQAGNARYCGRSTPRLLRMLPDGTVLSDRALSKVRGQERGHAYVERTLRSFGAPGPRVGESGAAWLERALPAVDLRGVRHGGNHRYVFAVGSRAQRRHVRIALDAGVYPKQL